MDIRDVVDRIALAEGKARYCLCLDTKDWDGFAAVLDEAMELDLTGAGGPVLTGRDAVLDVVRGSMHGATSVHQVFAPIMTIAGDAAEVVWAMQDRIVWDDGRSILGFGHYREDWVRRTEGWKLRRSRLTRLLNED